MSGFEADDAPSSDILNNCIRCGMCLPSCPTYQLTGRERSSPRGRISLIRAVAEGNIQVESDVFAQEMSDCLGCLACVTACPAGVQYGELLEKARSQLWRHHSPQLAPWQRWTADLLLGFFDKPWLLALGTKMGYLYQRSGLAALVERSGVLKLLPGHLHDFHMMLPPLDWRSSRQRIPAESAPRGASRGRLGMLLGCVMDVMFVRENVATVNILRRQGFTVCSPPGQGCCGALHAHAGRLDWARRQAQGLIETFEKSDVDAVVVNSAGCGACMKHYPQLLEDDPEWHERARRFSAKVKDVQEFLAEIPLEPPLPSNEGSVTYHDACHLAHGQGVRQAPRSLLQGLAGAGYRELGEADLCCGSAGTYNITHFETASELLDKKVANIEASGAQEVGVANPGCLLQIRYGLKRAHSKVRAEHPVVLLDEAWQARCGPIES